MSTPVSPWAKPSSAPFTAEQWCSPAEAASHQGPGVGLGAAEMTAGMMRPMRSEPRHVALFSALCVALLLTLACKETGAQTADSAAQADADHSGQDQSQQDDAKTATDAGSGTGTEQCPAMVPPDAGKWFHSGVGYEIFVRSFADSDGDGIGDLKGITSKLDYLNDGNPQTNEDLGISWIWLTPIFASPSYHGYDVTDYYAVNPQFGTMDDLKELVQECHKRGIKVVLDLVLNHASSSHPWFVASKGPTSEKRNWFVWSQEPKEWTQPWSSSPVWHKWGDQWYYGVFWSGMPDLNFNEPLVRSELIDIAKWWMKETGIDGYRLDAVRYLVETGPKEGQQDTPGTLEYWREFASGVLASYPEAMLLGEAWASNSIISAYRKDGKGLNISFDFDLMESIVAGVLAEEPADLEGVLCRLPGQFPSGSSEVTFLSNHDLTRVFSRLKAGASAMKFAAALLFTLPGTPMVYYGDEIGMQNGPLPKDEHKRLPMQWDATANAGFSTGTPWQKPAADYPEVNVQAQAAQSDSLLSWYRSLIALRRSTPALDAGGFQLVQAKSATTPLVWAFVRYLGQQQVYVVANFSNNPAVNVTVEFQAGGAAPGQRESAATLFPPGDAVVPATPTGYSVGDVPAQSIVVFRSSSAP